MADKKIVTQTFEAAVNKDFADQHLPPNQVRSVLNMRIYGLGTKGVAESITGNSLIDAVLPAGTNLEIGKEKDEENSCFYYCIWNSNNFHTIYKYNDLTKSVIIVLQSKTDSNGVDILRWSNLKAYRIHHINIVQNNLIYFCDALNKGRKFNIDKALDKSATGYGLTISEDFITAYKQTFQYAPVCTYVTDVTRNSNNLYSNLFKFTARPHYDDGEIGNWCDLSLVPKPPDQSYTGEDSITFDNNCIQVAVGTGNQLVKKIEVAVKINNTAAIGSVIQSTDFVVCAILDKFELQIADNSTYNYKFYNDGSYSETPQDKINRIHSFMQRVPVAQAFVKSAMTYTGGREGWEVVHVDMGVTVRLDDLYLPDDIENKQTAAQLIVNEISVDKDDPFFGGYRYNNITKFTIGNEVKSGVKFEIFGNNNKSDHYYYSYVAKPADTPSSVASFFKAALRSIGRGFPSNPSAITNEGVNGDGSVFFSYGYLGKWNESKTAWTSNVVQVSYQSLKDNGFSLQLIPYGSITNYAAVYIDDDGRESLAYTNAVSVVRTPYITEIGSYKRPVHVVTLNHTPPIDARYWRLVRTPQNHGLEIMIQKVINVTTDNTSEYLDLVVGSLLTYQKLHQNTIIQYEFLAGDRLRLIKNVETGVFYTGFLETEILSYHPTVTELKNESASIVASSDIITIGGITSSDNIGRVILINGYERTILSVESPTTYKVDSPNIATQGYTSYTLIDRRGTIRIKKPVGITIVDFSLVELFHPQAVNISTDYKLFNDCGQKYEIGDFGLPTRYHRANIQNQTTSQPAIVEVNTGDSYIRDRELPSNNVVPGTQVMISKVVDQNYSDFYTSDMTDLGRVYPQDDGKGVIDFGSRTRYSGNYIEDTGVNGLNDFDNLNRVDNNDTYGDIKLTKFFTNRLYTFKTLKDAFIPVSHTLTTDNSGNVLNVQSGKLLNEMQYFAWEGGIGNNPESWFYNGNSQYHASTNSGCFVRLGGEGVEPISTLFNYDTEARAILAVVDKLDLSLPGEYDRKYDEAIWSLPQYTDYIFNDGFDGPAWKLYSDLLPLNTTYEVTQQPDNGTVTYDAGLKSFNISGTILGDDFFLYRPILSGGGFGAVKKQCFTTVPPPPRVTQWRFNEDTAYCIQVISATVNITVDEHADPYSDSNVFYKVNGVDTARITGSGTTHYTVAIGKSLSFAAFSELPATGANPTKTMDVDKTLNGITTAIYGPTTNSNNPGDPDLTFVVTSESGAIYDVYATADATNFPADATGILVVDIFDQPSLNAVGFVDTSGATIPYQQPAYTGLNFFPNDGTNAKNCWVLASDQQAGSAPKWRWEFNIAQLMSLYPTQTSFVLKIKGRAGSSGTVSGQYNLKGADAGNMTMVGSPGTYIPSTSGATNIGMVTFSAKPVVGGADGTYGIGIGSDILTFTYNVSAKTITLS